MFGSSLITVRDHTDSFFVGTLVEGASQLAKRRKQAARDATVWKACQNMTKMGTQSANAHLRVWPCKWTRKGASPKQQLGAGTRRTVAATDNNIVKEQVSADVDYVVAHGTAPGVGVTLA